MKPVLQVLTLLLLLLSWHKPASSQENYQTLMSRYAELNLMYESDQELEAPLKVLLDMAEHHKNSNPDNADAWIASSRIRFGFANTQGPISGFRLMKQAKDEMEKAIQIDPLAQNGFPQGFLGYLYAGVPSWPISFGSDTKSKEYFADAFRINATGFEINYFFAVVQAATGNSELAIYHLNKAAESLRMLEGEDITQRLYASRVAELQARLD